MSLKAILLFLAVASSLANETPLIQTLPKKQFTASSSYNDTVKAPNVRFSTTAEVSVAPWCPATRGDYDYRKEYVTVDLGCPRTVHSVEGKDPYLLYFSGEYSNNKKNWKFLTSDDEVHFDTEWKFQANIKPIKLIKPSVRARFYRFRITSHDLRGLPPCIKAELYGEPDAEDSVEPMGCYNENPEKQHLPIVYHTVTSRVNTRNPDILAIYKECRQKAADYSKPLEIFGILNYNRCVTTETGKEGEYFKNALKSRRRHCKGCFDKGIGARETAVFVYKVKSLVY
ncbi:uncharacterized protein LOC144631835 isoform X2 [Oculina patagonica]